MAHFDMNQSPLSRARHRNFLDTAETISPNAGDIAHSDGHTPEDSLSNRNEELPIPEQPVSPSTSVALSGSKRKFSATEEELTFSSPPVTNTNAVDDDFQFTRAVDLSRTHSLTTAVENGNEPVAQAKKQPPKKGAVAKRRALEPSRFNAISYLFHSESTLTRY